MAGIEQGLRLAGRYLLLERLGDGGHAEVWAAEDEVAGARVALKFMHLQSCSTEDAMLVLRHEAQMARRLDHPGVLHVEEPLRDASLVFLPMEYASGGDVAQLRGASWRLVLPVLLQVARVLEHAHSRGVVHRDIKPGNVLLDASGAVRVTDFGTATRTGSTLVMSAGSPFYASPQQLRGEAATTADDVYGLGALAHVLLTRQPPWHPDFDPARIQREDVPRPVFSQPAPAGLLELVHAMLARDSAARPDMGQVMELLEQLLAGSPAPAAPPLRRLRTWLIVAAVAVVTVLLLLKGAAMLREHRVADDLARGAVLEASEQWGEAIAHYQAVLERDAALPLAQDGLARSMRRATLDDELARYLAMPGVLADAAERQRALRALARAEATIPRTTRLAAQIVQLREKLGQLDIIQPVR
jgi:hypothetical protein